MPVTIKVGCHEIETILGNDFCDDDGPWWRRVEDDRLAVCSYILSAYHIRIDDAYAAVGMQRGINKQRFPRYAADSWCQPAADLRRFVESGEARGAVPPWWAE